MITGSDIRKKRVMAEIAGSILSRKAVIRRGRLSDIELGNIAPSQEELAAIDAALTQLIVAKKAMEEAGAAAGWPA